MFSSSKILKLLLLSLFPLVLSAQSHPGWTELMGNDFFKARRIFMESLQKDSLQRESLEGMIAISEIFNDPSDYRLYVSRYLRHFASDALYPVFWNAYDENFEKTVQNEHLSESTRLEAGMQIAIEESDAGKDFNKNLERYRKLFPLIQWNLIGPFKNENGSGHAEVFPPEREGHRSGAAYLDESGRELSWVAPLYTAGSGRLYLDQHLAETRGNTDFSSFAQTYFELPEAMEFQIRMGRSAPIKVWINGYLVLNDSDRVRFAYDREMLQLKLPAGRHSLLIKLSGYNPLMDTYDLLSFFDQPSYNQSMLTVRFTNANGQLLDKIKTYRERTPQKTEPGFSSGRLSADALLEALLQKNNSPFLHFAYCKALIRNGQYKKADEYFRELLLQNQGSAFYAYLAAKSLAFNGKIEKAYPLMSALNQETTPVFGYLFEKHKEIDLKTDPVRFLKSIEFLNQLCPSARVVINNYLAYYDSRAMRQEKDAYIQATLKRYPEHIDWLESKLSSYVPPQEKFGAREEIKEQKAAIRRLKKGSNDDDYELAIEFYQGRKKSRKVLKLMQEQVGMSPHVSDYRIQLAEYQSELEMYEEAIASANEVLKINPYLSDAFELIGDCREKQNLRKEALVAYQTALKHALGYNRQRIRDKIEKIEGASRNKSIFDTPSFSSILKQSASWMPANQSEDALVLMYSRDLALNEYQMAEVYQKLMVLIQTDAGADRWTENDFRYLGNITSVKVIRPDGSESSPDTRGSSVVFKNLSPGDLIQIESRTEYELNGIFDQELSTGHFIFFQDPVYYSKLELAIPTNKTLVWKAHKFGSLTDSFQKDQFTHYRWQHLDLPGIEQEDHAPDQYDLYRSLQLSTVPDWSRVVQWYQRETYRRLEGGYEVKTVMDTLIKPGMRDQDKVQVIYQFITRNIKYSFVPFLNSRFIPKLPENTLSAGIGDCKDVATLMIFMLRQLGIESYYALVKSNHYHHLQPVPSLAFDHVIVCYILDGKKYYADLTTNYYPLQVLPEMDHQAVALLVKEGEKEVFRLPNDLLDAEKTRVEIKAKGTLNPDRSISMKVEMTESGAAAGRSRELFSRTPNTRWSNLLISQIGKDVFEHLELGDFTFEPLHRIDTPLTTTFTLNSSSFSDKVAGLYIIRAPWIRSVPKEPGITVEKRQNRIDLSAMLDVRPSRQVIELSFPLGYELVELPENVEISGRFGSYKVHYERIPGGVKMTKDQQFYMQMIETADFDDFKSYYLALLDAEKNKMAVQLRRKS